MKTIIVGAIDNYAWKNIEVWWKSLVLTGFNGEIHLLVYRATPETIELLTGLGIHIHRYELMAEQVVVGRFKDLCTLCNSFNNEDWVLFTDVGDIVFQKDPSKFLQACDGFSYVFTSEGILFDDNSWTKQNLISSMPNYYEVLKNALVYNAGCIAAKAKKMANLADMIYQWAISTKNAKSHDQVIMNILIRITEEIRTQSLFTGPLDGWCHCAASSIFAPPNDRHAYREKLPVIASGKCFVNNSLAYIFHHYTRNTNCTREVGFWVKKAWNLNQNKQIPYSKKPAFGV